MRRLLQIARLGNLVLILWIACIADVCAAGIKRAADAPKPRPPEESLKLFRLPKGFRIELVASEPIVADPTAMALDARGRIFVCEMHGYNLEGHLDVTELNKTGVLDTKVRRINAPNEILERASQDQYGTIKLLEDTDGDGRMDAAKVWADRLPLSYGLVPARDGLIVLCAPDIVYLADRDGDGKAEVRQKLFTGFGCRPSNIWSRINNPRWGVDNWIYAVCGSDSRGTIRGPNMPSEVKIGSVCFRFKPDGSALEPCSGRTSGFGQAITDWGDRFICTNQQHALYIAPLPHRYLARNPYYAAPRPTINICTYGHPAEVYPISQPHPWRLARSKDPKWMKFYGAAEATANGYFTAASGQTIYQATAFPPEYRGNHFSVDNAQNMVHRCLLQRDGTSYVVKRATQEKVEFLSTTEQWFRPVNLLVGPDGALYIVDMYREIIEDYSAIPRFLQQQYGLIEGCKRGRIWRVVADGAPGPKKFDLDKASTTELVEQLSNSNAWWRQTAQRLLVERADEKAIGPLTSVVHREKMPQARLLALYAIDGLGALQPALVERALEDSHFAVRTHALCLAERWLHTNAAVASKVFKMVDDADPRVRLQLGFTLGESRDERAVRALGQLGANYGADPWMQAAVLSSVADRPVELLRMILDPENESKGGKNLIHPLASVVGAQHNNQNIAQLLKTIGESNTANLPQVQATCLKGLVEGLKRGKPQVLTSPDGQAGLRRLLTSRAAEVRKLALEVAGLVKLNEAPEMKAVFDAATKVALDDDRNVDQRRAAVATLAGAPYATLAPLAEALLDARQPLDVQLAAVAALDSSDDPQVGAVLLSGWASHTPKVRDAVLDAIFNRRNRLPGLLDTVQDGTVGSSSLDAIHRVRLLESHDPKIRRRAKKLLAGQGPKKGRQDVLARYQATLKLPRNADRGKAVFEDQCAKCHRLGDQGHQVGPDLSAANNRADETLVSDIMDPGNQITAGYRSYTVLTEDGRIFTGVLAAETATSITLRKEEAVEETILRKDIDEMEASDLSMMPEDLEKEVSPQDVADLIAFLRKTLGPAPPPSVVLFEDDHSFAEVLKNGAGTATIETADRFSGTASLAVTPPQRFALKIPGWDYRITENPGPGEYRYIRFAWKSRKGQGVMIELAADGQWPPAEQPLHRYYSGKNTTGWAAVCVAPESPNDWVVVTRDLWKDFGTFTFTGIAPTAMGGSALFDRIELLRTLDGPKPQP